MPYRKVSFGKVDIRQTVRPDGSILLRSAVPLQPYPWRMTERLVHWANTFPDRIFMAQRDTAGAWQTYTYSETLATVKRLAQALLDRGLNAGTPVAILSENSVEHGLLALAALHAGVPHSPISPAYSLRSNDFAKLRFCLDLLPPGLIFVSDYKKYERALRAAAGETEIWAVQDVPENEVPGHRIISWKTVLNTAPTPAVDAAFEKIRPGTVAKILFTSGSTGQPKGVVNTHGNISANWQQLRQAFPFMEEELLMLDWLPWSHTFGGNHNFGLCSYLGGTFYIDGGNPTPAGIATTVANLREIAPTVYFNVPKGFEQLIPCLREEKNLCKLFFSRLKLLFYAGASISQPVWDALEELSEQTTGQRVVITAGLGCTESSPAALLCQKEGGFAGLLGGPVPGLDLKLAPVGDKLEARYRGPNITPGYWRQPEWTANGFDAEGFFCSGDALRFVDPGNPNAGMVFDGRISEDFKLSSATWVNVGALRTQLITAGKGLIHDAVITGPGRPFLGAIVFPELNFCKKISGLGDDVALSELIEHPAVREALLDTLNELARNSTGSATQIKRAVFATFILSIDAGEITDKGSINQGAVLRNRAGVVEQLYAETNGEKIVEINDTIPASHSD